MNECAICKFVLKASGECEIFRYVLYVFVWISFHIVCMRNRKIILNWKCSAQRIGMAKWIRGTACTALWVKRNGTPDKIIEFEFTERTLRYWKCFRIHSQKRKSYDDDNNNNNVNNQNGDDAAGFQVTTFSYYKTIITELWS